MSAEVNVIASLAIMNDFTNKGVMIINALNWQLIGRAQCSGRAMNVGAQSGNGGQSMKIDRRFFLMNIKIRYYKMHIK